MEQLLPNKILGFGKHLWRNLLILCLLPAVSYLISSSIVAELDPYDSRILDNVSVGGRNIGGMTREGAYRALKEAGNTILKEAYLSAELPAETLVFSPEDTGVSLKLWKAVNDAYRIGRTGNSEQRKADLALSQASANGHSLSLLPYLKINTSYLQSQLQTYAQAHDTVCTPSSYRLTGEMPDLEIENQSDTNQPQTLEVTFGLPTAQLDQEDALNRILTVYDNAFAAYETGSLTARDFQITILEEPAAPNWDAIYEELYIAPVDDSLNMELHEAIPGAFGYHFDLENAKKLAESRTWGETLSVPMVFAEPEIYGEDVYFQDVLGYCETPHTKDENRNNNLRRACESMNGLVLQPGDVFSYNDTLGPRTKENGYLRAGAYSGWTLVQSYGGGICQGSSTIYGAALYADLEIVFRRNHGYAVSYVDYGLDATVNWGGPEFQFRNSTNFPIKIAAEVSDGYVKVSILGTDERDYYIKMESEASFGSSHIYAKSYKCKYDRDTDELISRELEARSSYAR